MRPERRGLRVGVRTSAGTGGTFVLRGRVQTESVTGRLVTLRFAQPRDRTLGNIAPVARGVRFRPGSFLEVRVWAPGVRGVYHRLGFPAAGRRVRQECTLLPGSLRPTSCRRVA